MFSCLSDFYQFPFADSSPPPPPKESVFSVSWLSGCFSSSSISFNPSLPFNSQGYYMCFQDFTFHSFNKYSLNKYLWLTFSHSYTHVQTTKFCSLYNQKLILKQWSHCFKNQLKNQSFTGTNPVETSIICSTTALESKLTFPLGDLFSHPSPLV